MTNIRVKNTKPENATSYLMKRMYHRGHTVNSFKCPNYKQIIQERLARPRNRKIAQPEKQHEYIDLMAHDLIVQTAKEGPVSVHRKPFLPFFFSSRETRAENDRIRISWIFPQIKIRKKRGEKFDLPCINTEVTGSILTKSLFVFFCR